MSFLPTFYPRLWRAVLVTGLAATMATSAWAAPLAPGPVQPDANGSLAGEAADDVSVDWAAGAVPGTGRTMELLLEMQKQEASQAKAPPPSVAGTAVLMRPAAPLAATPALAAATERSGAAGAGQGAVPAAPALFGVTQAPAIRAQSTTEAAWQPGGSTPANSAARPSRPPPEWQRWLRLPADIIAWVRDNRTTVLVVAVLTLLLVAAGSLLIGRRRYAA